jgi:hypothetical protein
MKCLANDACCSLYLFITSWQATCSCIAWMSFYIVPSVVIRDHHVNGIKPEEHANTVENRKDFEN